LRQEYPGKDIPRVPAKNKTSTTAPSVLRNTIAAALEVNGNDSSDTASITSSNSGSSVPSPIQSPASSPPTGASTPSSKSSIFHKRSESASALHKQATSHDYHVPREKNRLTLRSFLRQITKDKRLGKSKALSQFLLKNPIHLGKEEEEDIERRLEMDRMRLREQRKFVYESRKRAKELDQWLRGFKSDLIRNRLVHFQQS